MALMGVTLQTTPPYSPESNAVAERFNRTLQDKVRTLIARYLWAKILAAFMTQLRSDCKELVDESLVEGDAQLGDLSDLYRA